MAVAALAAATANALLVMFVLAVALPLLPAKLVDPFWLLAFTGAFCSNGFLALLAVLLLHLAAALEPGSRRYQARLAQFRQAVERSSSIAELQSQFAAIQAPPLSQADQRQGLPALKADLLAQIKAQESSLQKQGGLRVPTEVLLRDSLRVRLLAPLLALAFSVSARRSSRTEVPA